MKAIFMSTFPDNLTYPIAKAKELIEELEHYMDNPKLCKFKSNQRRMSVKANNLRRICKAISSIIAEQQPYDKAK